MKVIGEFTKKSLLQNKKRTVVTIIGVIISAAMITAVSTFVASFLSMLQRSEIAENGNWHAMIRDVQAQNLATIENSDEVDDAVLAKNLGSAKLEGSQNEQKPYLYLRDYAENGFTDMSIRLISGRLPQKEGEVLLSETVNNSAGVTYSVGDTLTLTLGKRVASNGEVIADNSTLSYRYNEAGTERTLDETFVPEGTASFTVVGIMERPGFEYSWSAGCAALGYLDKASLSGTDTADVYLNLSHLSRGIYKTMPQLAEQAGKTKEDVTYNDNLLRYSGIVEGDTLFGFLYGFAAVIILIIAVASVSLIYNAFAISVSERAKQLGLLSSVGATRKQKRASVYYEAFFIGLMGVPLGILSGLGGMGVTLWAIQPLLKDFINNAEGVALTLVVSPFAIAAAVILSGITIFISAYIPARRASKIMPIDAIRQTNEVKLTRKTVKTSNLTRKLFGFEAEIALKNLKRSRKKYRATIVSLIISLVLFLTVSTYASMTNRLYDASSYGANFDVSVSFSERGEPSYGELSERIASMPHIKKLAQTTGIRLNTLLTADQLTEQTKLFLTPNEKGLYDFSVALTALDPGNFAEYAKAVGVEPSAYMDGKNPKAILINHGQAYFYSQKDKAYVKQSGDILKIGDSLKLFDEEGKDVPASVNVGAVTEERPTGTLLQDFNGVTMVVTEEVFQTLTKDLQGAQHVIYLTTDDDQALEKQLASLPGASTSFYIYNVQSTARAERNIQMFLGVFVYGFIILISLICIANIFNTVSTNIALRRKEFAMLRSVGMTPKSFNRMIRFESVFYGLKGLLYGLPISVAIAYLLHNMQQSVLVSAFTLPYKSYAFAILMILVIVFTTMLYSTGKIKKENIIDALKEESF